MKVYTDATQEALGGKFLDLGGEKRNAAHRKYGVLPSASGAANSAGLAQLITDLGTDGAGTAIISQPGIYDLATLGVNPYESGHRYCIDIPYDNVALVIGPGVTLRLASGQQTDAGGPVDHIVFRNRKNIFIGGGGKIIGNTAGQTGWTGGYAQVANGCIINGYTSGGSHERIEIGQLQLEDHWSNPINVGGGVESFGLLLHGIFAKNCGEGIQAIWFRDCVVINCHYSDPANVAVGDAIELSHCSLFSVLACSVRDHGDGAAFDLYGSQDGTLLGCSVDNWMDGLQFGTGTRAVDNITVADMVMKNIRNLGIGQGPGGRVHLNDVTMKDFAVGGRPFDFDFSAAVDVLRFKGGGIYNTDLPARIRGPSRVHFEGFDFEGCTTGSGLVIGKNPAGDEPEVVIKGGSAKDNAAWGIEIDGDGSDLFAPDVRIHGTDLRDNVSGPYGRAATGSLENVVATDIMPREIWHANDVREKTYRLTGSLADPAGAAAAILRMTVPDGCVLKVRAELMLSDPNDAAGTNGTAAAQLHGVVAKQGGSIGTLVGASLDAHGVGSGDNVYDWTPVYALSQVSNDAASAVYDLTINLDNAGTNAVRVRALVTIIEHGGTGALGVTLAAQGGLTLTQV